MITVLPEIRFFLLALALAVLWVVEGLAPHLPELVRERRRRVVHGVRNAVLAVTNGVLGILLLGVLIATSISLAQAHGFGLLRMIELPVWAEGLLALLLFDVWMYWWHRINHVIPFLWRFHRVHHSDPSMDVTTALRFHPGEIILSTAARLPLIAILGMELWQLALYELIATPVIALHHSNVNLPRRIDDALRWLIVTPWMHWVHHSRERRETNSNYSSLLSAWDRVFGTYRLHDAPKQIRFGLDEFPDTEEHQRLAPILKCPTK